MTLEQKIQKANSLKQEINDIKDFIEIIVDGQKYDERYNGQNYFRGISLSAEIWTGTQTCDYNLPSDALTIQRIEIKDENGDWYELHPITKEKINFEGIDDFLKKMNNTDTIKSFVNAGLEQLKVLLKEKQEELEKMFS